jgi:hypothetical protein
VAGSPRNGRGGAALRTPMACNFGAVDVPGEVCWCGAIGYSVAARCFWKHACDLTEVLLRVTQTGQSAGDVCKTWPNIHADEFVPSAGVEASGHRGGDDIDVKGDEACWLPVGGKRGGISRRTASGPNRMVEVSYFGVLDSDGDEFQSADEEARSEHTWHFGAEGDEVQERANTITGDEGGDTGLGSVDIVVSDVKRTKRKCKKKACEAQKHDVKNVGRFCVRWGSGGNEGNRDVGFSSFGVDPKSFVASSSSVPCASGDAKMLKTSSMPERIVVSEVVALPSDFKDIVKANTCTRYEGVVSIGSDFQGTVSADGGPSGAETFDVGENCENESAEEALCTAARLVASIFCSDGMPQATAPISKGFWTPKHRWDSKAVDADIGKQRRKPRRKTRGEVSDAADKLELERAEEEHDLEVLYRRRGNSPSADYVAAIAKSEKRVGDIAKELYRLRVDKS